MSNLAKDIIFIGLLCLCKIGMAQEVIPLQNNLGIDTKVDVNPTLGAFSAPKQKVQISGTGDQAGLNDTVANRYIERSLPASEFQNFIKYATGKSLPVFGDDFFAGAPSSFAPIHSTPIPFDYALGVGDEVLIRAWGSIEMDYRVVVDKNGQVSIPTLGTLPLAGVKAADVDAVIKAAIAKQYKDVSVSISFGRLRAITIYVVGQAYKPGSYTISGFSTLINALLVSGGPNRNGSIRNVQVKRQGKVVGQLDLYAFIAKGDKSGDVKLLNGDVIYIPAAQGHVAINGKVNTAAIYELRSEEETIGQILDLAGGLQVVTDPRRATLERIESGKQQPRSIEEFALDAEGQKKKLKNGDLLTMTSITPDFANLVTLRGNVDQAMRKPFKEGMRIRDLIPSREMLITRESVSRQNNAVNQANENAGTIAASIGSLIDEVNWEYAVIERIDRQTLNVSLIPFNLGRAMDDNNSADNLHLQVGDIVTIFSQNDVKVPMVKRKVYTRIEGEVNVPGVYQMLPGDTLATLLAKAGGITPNAYLFGTEFYRARVRQEQQVNLEKVTKRLESSIRTERAKALANLSVHNSINNNSSDNQLASLQLQANAEASDEVLRKLRTTKATGRVILNTNLDERYSDKLPLLKLENGDQLVIPNRSDFVHVYGAVNQESSLLWRSGLTVAKYLAESGPVPEADLDSIFIIRVNGSILSNASQSWFSSMASVEVLPGDSIVVPERLNKESTYRLITNSLKDWAQILSGFGLGAAAINSLK